MWFWSRVFGSKSASTSTTQPPGQRSWQQRPSWLVDGLQVAVMDGSEILEVVGESNYQDALWAIVGGYRKEYVRQPVEAAVLVPEDGNPYDADAVSVWIGGLLGRVNRPNPGW